MARKKKKPAPLGGGPASETGDHQATITLPDIPNSTKPQVRAALTGADVVLS